MTWARCDGRTQDRGLRCGWRRRRDRARGLRERGLRIPRLIIADGHLGIWSALADVFPEVAEQRCWNHKLVNVLDWLPKRVQAEARALLTQIPYADTREKAEALRDQFVEHYRDEHPAATETLLRFPREHWTHLRTTNVVESPFAVVRLRTNAGKRYKKVANATALIWRLLLVAEKTFRRLNHPELLPEVALGARYQNGIRVVEEHTENADEEAAA